MISSLAVQLSHSAAFQSRCEFFALKAAFAYASESSPTAPKTRFAKAAVTGALDLRRLALAVLATTDFGDVGDSDGSLINDGAIETAINSIAVNTGKALA